MEYLGGCQIESLNAIYEQCQYDSCRVHSLLLPACGSEARAVTTSWVYANAGQIPGVRDYVCFRPFILNAFLGGSETCQ
jgi:hypothetical protein